MSPYWENVAGSFLANFVSGILVLALAAVASYVRFPNLWKKSNKIRADFLTLCEVGVTVEWIRQKFGEPRYKQAEGDWIYHFDDAYAVLQFTPVGTVQSVIVALKTWDCRVDIPTMLHPIPPLGEATLAAVATCLWPHNDIVYDIDNDAARHGRITSASVHLRDGPTGAWRYFTCGALWPLTPGCLVETEFSFETENVIKKLEGVRVNWVGMSSSATPLMLDWDIGLNTQNSGA